MSPAPIANRPQYSGSNGPVPEFIDSSTAEFSRGMDPHTGAKGAEPTEPVPTLTSVSPTSVPKEAGQAVAFVGDNLGGSTGATIGGVAVTGFVVDDERHAHGVTGLGTAGAGKAIVVQNPAGNSSGGATITLT